MVYSRQQKSGIQGLLLELPIHPKPFLRWAGGKRKLAPIIEELFPNNFKGTKNFFYEPFVGGGALTFYLGNRNLKNFVSGKNLVINDVNPDLIATYQTIRDGVEDLISELKKLSKDLSRDAFEEMRRYKPKSNVNKAARFIYLNKTCFNGLWRVNGKGDFNVPWGKLKNPKIFDANELREVSMRLQGSRIRNVNFATAVEDASKGDLVYFDPPYIPLSNSSSFSKYAKDDFGIMDHFALSGVIQGLTSKGVNVILSNSDTHTTREIYGSILDLRQINVQRSISASSSSRVVVKEILGVNFPVSKQYKFSKLKVV
jgi:DNA adenine methylase